MVESEAHTPAREEPLQSLLFVSVGSSAKELWEHLAEAALILEGHWEQLQSSSRETWRGLLRGLWT